MLKPPLLSAENYRSWPLQTADFLPNSTESHRLWPSETADFWPNSAESHRPWPLQTADFWPKVVDLDASKQLISGRIRSKVVDLGPSIVPKGIPSWFHIFLWNLKIFLMQKCLINKRLLIFCVFMKFFMALAQGDLDKTLVFFRNLKTIS